VVRQDIVKLVYVPVYKKIFYLNPQTRKPDRAHLRIIFSSKRHKY